MTQRVFETSLRAFQIRQPFRPFIIGLHSGSEILVPHPGAVVTQSGSAVHFSPDGGITIFDSRSVSQLCDIKKQRRVG
jgi:hypothetical protein